MLIISISSKSSRHTYGCITKLHNTTTRSLIDVIIYQKKWGDLMGDFRVLPCPCLFLFKSLLRHWGGGLKIKQLLRESTCTYFQNFVTALTLVVHFMAVDRTLCCTFYGGGLNSLLGSDRNLFFFWKRSPKSCGAASLKYNNTKTSVCHFEDINYPRFAIDLWSFFESNILKAFETNL